MHPSPFGLLTFIKRSSKSCLVFARTPANARVRMRIRNVVSGSPCRGETVTCAGSGRNRGGPGSVFSFGDSPPQPLSSARPASPRPLATEQRTHAVDEPAALAARAVRAAAAAALVRPAAREPAEQARALVLLPGSHAVRLPGAGGAHAVGAVQPAIGDELRELHGVRRRALAQVVAHD